MSIFAGLGLRLGLELKGLGLEGSGLGYWWTCYKSVVTDDVIVIKFTSGTSIFYTLKINTMMPFCNLFMG